MRQARSTVPRPELALTTAALSGPATLTGDPGWADDRDFLAALEGSWRSQYADYLGAAPADELIDRLLASGDLTDHDPALTLTARIDGLPVGIGALRQANDHRLVTLLEVVEPYRHLGIGRQLMQAMLSRPHPIIVHVSVYRPGMLTFYEKLGLRYFDRITVPHYGYELEFDVMFRQ